MKKFMTVLLVIAVMFTFSFSTAFAATTYTADQVVAAMQAEADDYCKLIEAQGTQYLKSNPTVSVSTTPAFTASKEAVAAVVADAVADTKVAFLAEVIKLQALVSGTYDLAGLNAEVAKVATLYTGTFAAGKAKEVATLVTDLDLSIAQFGIAKTEALAALAKIDPLKYSDSTKDEDKLTVTAGFMVNMANGKFAANEKVAKRTYVEAVVTYVTGLINETVVSETDDDANATAIANFAAWADNAKAVTVGIDTLEDEAEADKADAEDKAYKTAIMEGELALAKAKSLKVLNDKLADLKKASTIDKDAVAKVEAQLAAIDAQYDAAKEVLTAYISVGAAAGTSHLVPANYAGFTSVETALNIYADRAEAVKNFKAYAEIVTNVTDAEGAALYDAEEVAKIVKAEVVKLYNGTKTFADVAKVETFDAAKIAASAGLAAKSTAITTVNNYKNAADYDKAQAAELKAIKDAAAADIMAAVTQADINKIVKAAKEQLDKVVTKSQHALDWNKATGKLGKEFDKNYEEELGGYAAYALAKLPTTGYTDARTALGTADGTFGVPAFAMAIVKEAYTVEEIAAKVAEAKTAIDGLMSDKALEEAADAVEALISAIKVPVTLEQKEVVLTADAALKAYIKNVGAAAGDVANKALLDAAKGTLGSLVQAELAKEFDALNKATLTAADEAAVLAFEAAVKEYNETFGASYAPNVAALKSEVVAAKFVDVRAAMVAIPANITVEAKAVIEAARAAYDALTLEEKVTFGADKLNVLYLEKLEAAEVQLAVAEAAAKAEAEAEVAAYIASVEGMKIKANSSAKKGSITVKWTVDEEVEGVKYQVYKSTKAQTGYKKSITTTKTSFKNTKNLKKGTRYYYKVRAIAEVEGVTYYSDWSNKANRIAK